MFTEYCFWGEETRRAMRGTSQAESVGVQLGMVVIYPATHGWDLGMDREWGRGSDIWGAAVVRMALGASEGGSHGDWRKGRAHSDG